MYFDLQEPQFAEKLLYVIGCFLLPGLGAIASRRGHDGLNAGLMGVSVLMAFVAAVRAGGAIGVACVVAGLFSVFVVSEGYGAAEHERQFPTDHKAVARDRRNRLRNLLAAFLKLNAAIAIIGGTLWGISICAEITAEVTGSWLAAWILAPIGLLVAPFYAAFVRGDWLPMAVCYGGVIVGAILQFAGSRVAASNSEPQSLNRPAAAA